MSKRISHVLIPRSIHAVGCPEARSKRTNTVQLPPHRAGLRRRWHRRADYANARVLPSPRTNLLRGPTTVVFSCSKVIIPSLIRLGRIPSNRNKHMVLERERKRERERDRERQKTETETETETETGTETETETENRT